MERGKLPFKRFLNESREISFFGRSSSSGGWQRWFFTGIGMAAALFIV
jgi:hypothetical protein